MNLSSTGNAAPKIRSINVCANLLVEWTSNQVRFRSESVKCLVGIALCLITLGSVVPGIERLRIERVGQLKKHESELEKLTPLIAQATTEKTAAEPKVASSELLNQTSGYFNRMIGEFYFVLDASKSGMAFSSTKIEVLAAEMVIDCRAEAESYEVAAAFSEQAGQTPNKISTMASTRPSTLLGPAGISFEYLKKVPIQ